MAAESYHPYATVALEKGGTPYEHIQTSPATFGAEVGQAEQKLGGAIEGAGGTGLDIATKVQHEANESAVNDAQAKYSQAVTALLYSPESAAGANDGGFYTKRGDHAGENYQTTLAAMEKLKNDARTGLGNDNQRKLFDGLTRRTDDLRRADIGRHVDHEITQAADKKTEALLATTGQTATLAASAGNMDLFHEAIDQGTAAAKSWGETRGYGADWGNKYSQAWVGQTVSNAAKQMVQGGNLAGASMLVDRYAPEMDKASLLSVKTTLKGHLEDQVANNWAKNAVYGLTQPTAPGGPPGAGNPGDIPSLAGRIIDIEGETQNPRSSAVGVGQFTNRTWLDTVRRSRPDLADKPDSEILAMRGNRDFATAMTHNLTAQNASILTDAGLPTTPGNVYLAHFLGPRGAIEALSSDPDTPVSTVVGPTVMKANPFLEGKSVGDLTQWANTQMAGVGPRAAVKMDKAQVLNAAMTAFDGNPAMQKKVSAEINRQYTAVQLGAAAAVEAQRVANESAANGYVVRMMKGETQGLVDAIASDPNLKHDTREHLWNMALTHAQKGLEHDVKTYGSGFYDLYQRVHAPQGDPRRITDPTELYQHVGDQPGTNNLQAAQREMALTPEETNLYQHHLDNLPRAVKNPDGSQSTALVVGVNIGGREYNIPTIWEGKKVSVDEAIDRATKAGLQKFPSYGTPEEANGRYGQMHGYIERDRAPSTGDLTIAGVDKLALEISGRRTPEGEAEGSMKKQFFANAKAQISGTNDGLHIKDPKGDELYLKWMARAIPAYDEGRKAGKTPSQLLDPDSPDYVGKSIKTFKRPMSQWMSDMLQDGTPGAAAGAPEAEPTYDTPESIVAAFHAGKLTRADAEALAVQRGFVAAKAAAPAPAAPAAAPGPQVPLR